MFLTLSKDIQRKVLYFLKDEKLIRIQSKVLDDEDDFFWKVKYENFVHKFVNIEELIPHYLNKKNLNVSHKYYYEDLCYEKYLSLTNLKTSINKLLKDENFLSRHINVKDSSHRTLLAKICLEIKESTKDEDLKIYYAAIRELIKHKADVNVKDYTGRSIVHTLTCDEYKASIEVVKILIEAGVDVDLLDDEEKSPLETCLHYKTFKILDLLTKAGANVNRQNKEGVSILMIAVKRMRTEAFESLLGAKVKLNLDLQDNDGDTALHYAVIHKERSYLTKLLKAGASTEIKNSLRDTPLFCAIDDDDKYSVKRLVQYGADVNYIHSYDEGEGVTPIVFAKNTNEKLYRIMMKYKK
jgi:ankyrin repeat protein